MKKLSVNSSPTFGSETKLKSTQRRSFLMGLTALIGSAGAVNLLGGNALSVAMAYQGNTLSWQSAGRLLTQQQMHMLRDICQIVIPKTDTPGAADLDTHGFIDNQLVRCYLPEQQIMTVNLLERINAIARKRFAKDFVRSSEQQQLSLLISIENTSQEFNISDTKHFAFLKKLIVFGYFTTEIGATKELAYLPVPGGFKGSIPYSSIGKAWLID